MFKKFALLFLVPIFKFFLSLRYCVEIKGKDVLIEAKKKKKGVLILPNHIALIDPVIVGIYLYPFLKIRPVMDERFYYVKLFRWFMEILDVIPIPDFELVVNEWKTKQGEIAYRKLKKGLSQGDNILLYPAGGLKQTAKEHLAGKSFVHRLITENPNIDVLLIRTTGLWGSSFSRAITGESPDFLEVVKRGIRSAFKNGIFFAPRRKVTIEAEWLSDDFPYQGSKSQMNRYLEAWYNRYTYEGLIYHEEHPQLVPYVFYQRQTSLLPLFNPGKLPEMVDLVVPPQMRETILEKLSKMTSKPINQIKDTDNLTVDLGCDSLDMANLIAFLDQEYDIHKKTSSYDLQYVYDLFLVAQKKKVPKTTFAESPKMKRGWKPERKERVKSEFSLGKTIPEAFLERCKKMGSLEAIADEGVTLTYSQLKQSVVVLAKKLKTLEGRYIGVLLPTSVGGMVVTLAIQMAGKVPVMLNFTAGVKATNHAISTLSIQHVVSARRFLDRVPNLELGLLDRTLILAEDIKDDLSLGMKIGGAILAKRSTATILRHFSIEGQPDEMPAMVLMTSGTENHPKCTLLSHRNLISNMEDYLDVFGPVGRYVFFGALPFFHAFGINPMGLFPVLFGHKVFFSPDPTDSNRLARESYYWKPTIISLTPSFYANFLQTATLEQLASYRLFISGAEKAPNSLRETIEQLDLDVSLIEGYGITETSPVISAQRFGEKPLGVGRPVKQLEVHIVHPETYEFIEQGKEGEIIVRGPSVFKGYAEKDLKSPFVFINGLCYYCTGDYGYIDELGNIILKGRLKRFVKIGGEMVSLPMIEEALTMLTKKLGWSETKTTAPLYCIIPIEEEGKRPELILFSVVDVQPDEVNKALYEEGFAKIVKINKVEKIKTLPLLGSGKVNLKALIDLAKKISN